MGIDTATTQPNPPDKPENDPALQHLRNRTRIASFTIRRTIAAGGMGVVYEALQDSPHRPVALKVMLQGLVTASARERFTREATLLASLQHPGIVQIYESGVHHEEGIDIPSIAMEFITGARTLSQYVRDKSADTRAILLLVIQACAAVAHGHTKGIIHRDLKPSNILVDPDGRVRLIDFGVARSLHSDAAPITLQTDVGQLIGTVAYMSPEQIDADPRAIDHRVDIYSLGVILFELLAGTLPFDLSGKSISEASRTVKDGTPPKLSTITGGISRDLETIVMKAMARDRADRYPDAAALANDLDRYLNDLPIAARPISPFVHAARTWKSWARREHAASSALIILMSAASAFAVTSLLFKIDVCQPILQKFESSMGAPSLAPLDNTVIVTADTEPNDPAAVRDFLSRVAIRAESPQTESYYSDPNSLKSAYASFLRSLKDSGVRIVVIDLFIRTPATEPHTQDLLAAVSELRAAGIPVIMALPDWPVDAESAAGNQIRSCSAADFAGTAVAESKEGPHSFVAAQRDNNDVAPGLPLAAAMAYRHGSKRFDYSFDRIRNRLDVAVRPRDNSPSLGATHELIEITSMQSAGVLALNSGLRPTDTIGTIQVALPTLKQLDSHSVSIADMLNPAIRPHALDPSGRAVFLTPGKRDEVIAAPGSSPVRAYAAQVAAFDALLKPSAPRLADLFESLGATLASSLLGYTLARLIAPQLRSAAFSYLAVTLAAALASTLLVSLSLPLTHIILHHLAPLLASTSAALLACFTFRVAARKL